MPEQALLRERARLLRRLQAWLDTPMTVLAFVWLALLVRELVWGASSSLEAVGFGIWGIFIVHFLVEFFLAPRRSAYLKRNWLTAVSLLVPALRIFRIVRMFRVLRLARSARGLRLLRVFTSLNRSMGALGASLSRRGFGYIAALTLVVTLGGAAGMYGFEKETPDGIRSYGDALWWTAMIMTTMGSQYWPHSIEGRVLCVALALYAFGVFGYFTATLATFFVGRDAENPAAEVAGAKVLAAMQADIAAIRTEVRGLAGRSTAE